MATRKLKPLPADASLVQRIEETVGALQIGPQHSGLVGLALLLARSLDEMDAETRQRMVGQTAGALLRTLTECRSTASPKPWSKWDDMAPGAVASRRLGAGTY